MSTFSLSSTIQPLSAVLCALLVGAFVLATPAQADAKSKWEKITSEKGVTVFQRDDENRSLPMFRGVGVINASVYDILAVLNDTPNNAKWMHNCKEARVVKKLNQFERIVYNRTDAPWPVDDRDVVVQSKVTYKEKTKQVIIKFNAIKGHVKVTDEAVRMPRLRGHYKLTILGDQKTRLEYQIDADPGGMIPDMLAASASKDLPLHTVTKLRARVMSTKKAGTYKDFLKKWDPAHGGNVKMEDIPKK